MGSGRRLNAREQATWLKYHWPQFFCSVNGSELICRGLLRPTPLSREYSVVIHYEFGRQPRVFIPRGHLQRRDDGLPIPHTYADDEPCLYYPKNGEWHSGMKIATTVVGWLLLWLVYYEVWRATGDWMGGGIEHRAEEKP